MVAPRRLVEELIATHYGTDDTSMDDVLKQFGTFIAEETKAELGSSTGDAHEVIIEDLSVVIRFQKI